MLPFQADLQGRQMEQVNRRIEKIGSGARESFGRDGSGSSRQEGMQGEDLLRRMALEASRQEGMQGGDLLKKKRFPSWMAIWRN